MEIRNIFETIFVLFIIGLFFVIVGIPLFIFSNNIFPQHSVAAIATIGIEIVMVSVFYGYVRIVETWPQLRLNKRLPGWYDYYNQCDSLSIETESLRLVLLESFEKGVDLEHARNHFELHGKKHKKLNEMMRMPQSPKFIRKERELLVESARSILEAEHNTFVDLAKTKKVDFEVKQREKAKQDLLVLWEND